MSLARAILSGDVAELPSRRDEAWRWSDIRGLVRVLPGPSAPGPAVLPPGPFEGAAEDTITIVNGQGPEALRLADGEARAIVLRYVGAGDGAHVSRLAIDLAGGSRLTLLESHEGEGAFVTQADLAITIALGAALERIVIADEPEGAVSVTRAEVALREAAQFAQTVITTGARRQRLETVVDHAGHGARARLDGLYLVDGRRHADITTVVRHLGPHGATDQLTKGVVAGQGRGVFQGLIEVARGADGADARMGHHALVVGERAEVDAKPELQIYADDVACTHGNSIGALDEEALFYARQRGIPEAQARALLTEAFVIQVVDRIEHPAAREAVRAFVARQTARLA
jgi:Fe-S cluster assembly protein SufD